MAIFAGIAWGGYLQGPWQHSLLPLVLGTVAIVANGFSLLFVNQVRHLKVQPMVWQQIPSVQRTRLEFILGNVANRDFSVVVLLFAFFALLPWFLWIAAVGSAFFALVMGWTTRQALLPKPS